MNDKELQRAKVFFIYLDRTTDVNPKRVGEVFYVGKGKIRRVKDKKPRNKKWKGIAKKYGWKREVIFATKNEKFAFEMEKILIKEHKTFVGMADAVEIACNFTEGGDGASGFPMSNKVKKILYNANSGEKNKNSKLNAIKAEEIRKKYIEGSYLHQLANEYNVTHGTIKSILMNKTWKISDNELLNIVLIRLFKEKSKDNNATFKLTEDDIINIRNKYATGNYFIRELAREYNVNKTNIKSIIDRKTWNYIEETELEINAKSAKTASGENSSSAKLTLQQVDEIRSKYITGKFSQRTLASEYDVCCETIRKVVLNINWYNENYGKIIAQEGILPNKPIYSDEVRAKMSKDRKGKNTGVNHHNFGKPLSVGSNNPQAKLKEQDIIAIREKYTSGNYIMLDLGKEYNVSRHTISDIIKGKSWKHI
jgi:NUMOD3 motif